VGYAIASHIYTCATQAGVVVLDAHHGKYSIIPIDRARSLEGVVQGWPSLAWVETVAGNGPTSCSSSSLLNSLLQAGMVTPKTDLRFQVSERSVGFVAQEALLDALAAAEAPKIRWQHALTFTLSVTYATVMLKYRPFDALLHAFRRRKEYKRNAAANHSVDDLRECVKAFNWLRPFAYAESDACLLDSVALTDFLFRQGMSADFLIGVRIQPFAAHSWVQAWGFALNGLPEHLAAFTPILSV